MGERDGYKLTGLFFSGAMLEAENQKWERLVVISSAKHQNLQPHISWDTPRYIWYWIWYLDQWHGKLGSSAVGSDHVVELIGSMTECVRTTSTLPSHAGCPEAASPEMRIAAACLAFIASTMAKALLPLLLALSFLTFLFSCFVGIQNKTCLSSYCFVRIL